MRMKTVEAVIKTKSSVEALMMTKALQRLYYEGENCRSYDEDEKLYRGYVENKSSAETIMRRITIMQMKSSVEDESSVDT